MADSIRIDTGEKRILINDDPARVIVFNPSDVTFAERFEAAYRDFRTKELELGDRSKELEANKMVDENGIPDTLSDNIALMRSTCEYMRAKIDEIFGRGTSKTAFGDAMNLDMFSQFFGGITPYIQVARSAKVSQYAPPPTRKRHSVKK